MRTVTIDAALNGFIVHVGCQTLVFNSAAILLKELDEYLADPGKKEAEARKTALHKQLFDQPCNPSGVGPRNDIPVFSSGLGAAAPDVNRRMEAVPARA